MKRTSPWQTKADICQVVPSCKLRAHADADRLRTHAGTDERARKTEGMASPSMSAAIKRRARRFLVGPLPARRRLGTRHGAVWQFLPDMRAANRRSPSRQKSWPANRLFKSTEVVYDCRQARQSGKAKPDFSIHPRISVKNCQREDASERKCWKQAMRNGAETDNENGGSRRRERRERCGIGRRKRRGRERRRRASTARRAERERTSAARQHRSGRRRRALHIGHAHARWLRNKRVYNDARVQRHGALPTPPATQPNRRVFAGQKG